MKKDIPNKQTMESILEAIDDMKDNHLQKANTYDELEKLLDS